ncbi:MAG: TonB-dependent receptor [Methylotenera sp.]|nr:TonB-dependent receptor [Methylotenera sp.]
MIKPIHLCVLSALAISYSHTAFAEHNATVHLDEINVVEKRLEPSDASQTLLNEMDTERSVTPGAVTVIDGESLQKRNVGNLADMLRYLPGVWATSYNGNDDVFYSSRGSNLDATDYDKNGVKFFQDGLPVTTADGNNHNRAIDALNARAVVFAHGANALTYGASTLGGAVDFVSLTGRTTSPLSVSLSSGSFGEERLRATAGGVSGRLDGLISVEAMQRDGYRDHSEQERKSAYANVGVQMTEDVSTRFYATYIDTYLELPRELTKAQYKDDPYQARTDAISGNHSKDVKSWRLAFKTTVNNLAGGTLEFGMSHEEQSLYHPIVSLPFFSLLIDTDHKDSGAMVRYKRDVGNHGLLFGANYGFSTVKGANYNNIGGKRGTLRNIVDDDATSLELFAMDRWKFAPDWTLVYGTQYVSANRDAGGVVGDYNAFNPRVGLIFDVLEGIQWYANVSRVYEPPTTFELRDDVAGTGIALDAMHGTVVETGIRGVAQTGHAKWNWDVTAYYSALRNEILSIDNPAAPGNSLSSNIDKTTHAGIESLVGASFDVGGGHRIEPLLSATVNAFSFDSDPTYGNNRLPAAPRWFARGELMYANTSGFRVGPTFDLVGSRYVDFANTYKIGSFGLYGARAEYTTGHWNVYAEARNLADKDNIAAVTVKDRAGPNDQVLQPGAPRSFYVGARYQF